MDCLVLTIRQDVKYMRYQKSCESQNKKLWILTFKHKQYISCERKKDRQPDYS